MTPLSTIQSGVMEDSPAMPDHGITLYSETDPDMELYGEVNYDDVVLYFEDDAYLASLVPPTELHDAVMTSPPQTGPHDAVRKSPPHSPNNSQDNMRAPPLPLPPSTRRPPSRGGLEGMGLSPLAPIFVRPAAGGKIPTLKKWGALPIRDRGGSMDSGPPKTSVGTGQATGPLQPRKREDRSRAERLVARLTAAAVQNGLHDIDTSGHGVQRRDRCRPALSGDFRTCTGPMQQRLDFFRRNNASGLTDVDGNVLGPEFNIVRFARAQAAPAPNPQIVHLGDTEKRRLPTKSLRVKSRDQLQEPPPPVSVPIQAQGQRIWQPFSLPSLGVSFARPSSSSEPVPPSYKHDNGANALPSQSTVSHFTSQPNPSKTAIASNTNTNKRAPDPEPAAWEAQRAHVEDLLESNKSYYHNDHARACHEARNVKRALNMHEAFAGAWRNSNAILAEEGLNFVVDVEMVDISQPGDLSDFFGKVG